MSLLNGKHLLLGVSGSIAAYKAADLASRLTQQGAQVQVILTPSAERFISPLTFASLTGQPAFTDASLWGAEAHILHVGLAHQAQALLIAPCSANTLAKLAQGQADNLLTITALAAGNLPLCLAPAMDAGMYEHPATQENVRRLQERGAHFFGPLSGRMASGLNGLGRMMEPAEIAAHFNLVFAENGCLRGKRILVTAGGSQQPIDPVRYIANRSSGKQGYALAQAALEAGATVTLLTHPTRLPPPVGAEVIEVRTAQDMLTALRQTLPQQQALLMAAAVADFQVRQVADQKLKKRDGIPSLELEAAPDLLAEVAQMRPHLPLLKAVIGFAAESRDLLENAAAKLQAKKLDFIAANDISASDAGFAVETNRLLLLYPDGRQEALPLLSKFEAAQQIVRRVSALLEPSCES